MFGKWAGSNSGRGARAVPLALLLALLVPLLAACSRADDGPEEQDLSGRTIRVVATTGQVADAVRIVGGERVEVRSLMGPGVDPHLYKASEGDVVALTDADMVFYNGLHLEGKMGEVLEQLAEERPVTAVAEAVPAESLQEPPEFGGNPDPHVWFDPTLWAYAVDAVRDALAAADPEHEETYRTNAEGYRAQLAELDAYAAEQLGSIPAGGRVLVTAHDAFGYFGARYGLEVVGLQGISTESEAGIADVQRVAGLIAERGVRAIFVESSVPVRTVEAVQAAVRAEGGEVAIGRQLYSDALGAEDTLEGTYVGMFRWNIDSIVAGLRG